MKKLLTTFLCMSIVACSDNYDQHYEVHNIRVVDIRDNNNPSVYVKINDTIQRLTFVRGCNKLNPEIKKGDIINSVVSVNIRKNNKKDITYTIPNEESIFCKKFKKE